MSEEANTLQTRLRELKAEAYDALAAVEHNQRKLQNLNSEIIKINTSLQEIVTGAGDQV